MTDNRVIVMFYELKDANNGTLLETNWDKDPITFISGLGQIIPKLEEGVFGLNSGDDKIIKIDAKDGVGEYDDNAIQSLPKEQFAGIELVEGMELFGQGDDGSAARVIVKAIGEEEVMIDFNHPYAGKDLEFKVKIVENREASADEIANGVVAGSSSCGCASNGGNDGGCCGGAGHDENHKCCGEHEHVKKVHECCGGHGENGGCCDKE